MLSYIDIVIAGKLQGSVLWTKKHFGASRLFNEVDVPVEMQGNVAWTQSPVKFKIAGLAAEPRSSLIRNDYLKWNVGIDRYVETAAAIVGIAVYLYSGFF